MNLKKIAAMAMSTVMALSMGCMTAFAADTAPEDAKLKQTLVKATVESSYTVFIPQVVNLTNASKGTGTYSKAFNIKVKGDIAEAASIDVTATAPTMTNQKGTTKASTLTNTDKTNWDSDDVRTGLAADGTGTLVGAEKEWSVSAVLTPGYWTGLMTYTITLNDSAAAEGGYSPSEAMSFTNPAEVA